MRLLLLVLFISSSILCHAQPTPNTEEEERLERRIATRHPYIVSIRNGDFPVCSGTLIGRQSVITAASCVDPRFNRDFLPTLWLNALYPRQFTEGVVVREAIEVYFHPNYTANVFDGFDLAILKLNETVSTLIPIRVFTLEPFEIPLGTIASVLYYGRSSFHGARFDVLQITALEFLHPAFCENNGFGFNEDLMYCVSKAIMCTEDRGGPVFRDRERADSDTLYAVVSGTLCREESEVAGVTSVLVEDTVYWVGRMRNVAEEVDDSESSTTIQASASAPDMDFDFAGADSLEDF